MNNGMIQVHEDALSSSNTLYHEFLLAYKESRKEVYGFVEGKEDPMYYTGLIENRVPREWGVRLIRSGNKRKVLAVLDLFDWGRFDEKRICFFIDRDLSEFTGDNADTKNNLYITDGYSLENQIATPNTLIRVIKEIYGLSDLTADEEQAIIAEYKHNFGVFSEELVSIMSQIVVWRRNGSNACLDNIKMNKLFKFDGQSIVVQEACRVVDRKLSYIVPERNPKYPINTKHYNQ